MVWRRAVLLSGGCFDARRLCVWHLCFDETTRLLEAVRAGFVVDGIGLVSARGSYSRVGLVACSGLWWLALLGGG